MGIKVSLLRDEQKSAAHVAVSSARTCYSSKGPVIYDGTSYGKSEHLLDINERIRVSTLKAGHNTTRQHGAYTFVLDGISRQVAWSFLHSHPFYNSEQVSQRYVEVKKDNFVMPVGFDESQREVFQQGLDIAFEGYTKLNELLVARAEQAYYDVFKVRAKRKEMWQGTVKKRVQEVSRYILPVAASTYMFHTINPLTLMRLYQCADHFNVPGEQKELVSAMVNEVAAKDPTFLKELEVVGVHTLEDSLEYKLHQEFFSLDKQKFCNEFDLDLKRLRSKLVGYDLFGEKNLARAVRSVLQVSREALVDERAIELVLNAAYNQALAETNNISTMTKLGSVMAQVAYTFMKKISHTADSQNQRHRMVMETAPIFYVGEKPDVIVPSLIEEVPLAKEYFLGKCEALWLVIGQLRERGATDEQVQYLAPNAVAVRILEQGNLRDRHHKYKMRLCYNAQEEIWRTCVEEVQQIKQIHPLIGKHLLPPCTIRSNAGVSPKCSEGDRYCGVQVWKLGVEEYVRSI